MSIFREIRNLLMDLLTLATVALVTHLQIIQ